jgi:hypothetical protein
MNDDAVNWQGYTKTSRPENSFARSSIGRRASDLVLDNSIIVPTAGGIKISEMSGRYLSVETAHALPSGDTAIHPPCAGTNAPAATSSCILT